LFPDHQLRALTVNLDQREENDFEDSEVRMEKICEEKINDSANLDLHVESDHQNLKSASEKQHFTPEKIVCSFCKEVFESEEKAQNHLLVFHKIEAVRCKFRKCGEAFGSNQELKEHLEKDHQIEEKKLLECKLCKKIFYRKQNLKQHVKNHAAAKSFCCLFCAESFENELGLYQHTKKSHNKEAVKCQLKQCSQFFQSKEQMEEHLKNKCKLNCEFCHSIFSCEMHLSTHLRKVHIEKKCKIYRCTFYADSEEEMRIHLKEVHVKTYDCVYCGKLFREKQYRNGHIKSFCTKTIGLIKCNFFHCANYFQNAAELEKHKKEAHTIVQRCKMTLNCPFCQKSFSSPKCVGFHVRKWHSEALRCKYKLCNSYFKSQAELEKHDEEKHVGKFVCAFCKYASWEKRFLKEHIENRHLPRDKKCPRCPKLFGSKKQLHQHVYTCKA